MIFSTIRQQSIESQAVFPALRGDGNRPVKQTRPTRRAGQTNRLSHCLIKYDDCVHAAPLASCALPCRLYTGGCTHNTCAHLANVLGVHKGLLLRSLYARGCQSAASVSVSRCDCVGLSEPHAAFDQYPALTYINYSPLRMSTAAPSRYSLSAGRAALPGFYR